MYRLSSIMLLLWGFMPLLAQSPHGAELKIDCAQCHNSSGWEVSLGQVTFDHGGTDFALEGEHAEIDCRMCHSSMVFSEAPMNCVACHTDMHSMSVGNDCVRCHSPESWLVDDIPELHEENGFPLIGAHANLSCVECHFGETNLRFDRIGNECISCHREDYASAERPNHVTAGYSTSCTDCHSPLSFGWNADPISHDFFPLTLGHDIQDCNQCHTTGNFSDASPECVGCHQTDFNTALSPNHVALGLSTDCIQCHTTDAGWMPASFDDHDAQFFPIYSGEHQGEWNDCVDCHTNPNNISEFSCTTCHRNPGTDNEHSGISGYTYESRACFGCHPNGSSDGAFDHNTTNFPLTESHIGVDCIACHANGFAGTPTACFACHDADYNGSSNPTHTTLGISTDCVVCHTAAPDWMPATFPVHNDYYALNGAHAGIANDCATCHNGDYTNTPNTCVGCHLDDYNATNSPNHSSIGFSTDCAGCHSETEWDPSTFDHDAQNFPIFSGSHQGTWNTCTECHTTPGNLMVFSCLGCHKETNTNNDHTGVSGYVYESNACFACHPTGN